MRFKLHQLTASSNHTSIDCGSLDSNSRSTDLEFRVRSCTPTPLSLIIPMLNRSFDIFSGLLKYKDKVSTSQNKAKGLGRSKEVP
jgi:hypothetical protein